MKRIMVGLVLYCCSWAGIMHPFSSIEVQDFLKDYSHDQQIELVLALARTPAGLINSYALHAQSSYHKVTEILAKAVSIAHEARHLYNNQKNTYKKIHPSTRLIHDSISLIYEILSLFIGKKNIPSNDLVSLHYLFPVIESALGSYLALSDFHDDPETLIHRAIAHDLLSIVHFLDDSLKAERSPLLFYPRFTLTLGSIATLCYDIHLKEKMLSTHKNNAQPQGSAPTHDTEPNNRASSSSTQEEHQEDNDAHNVHTRHVSISDNDDDTDDSDSEASDLDENDLDDNDLEEDDSDYSNNTSQQSLPREKTPSERASRTTSQTTSQPDYFKDEQAELQNLLNHAIKYRGTKTRITADRFLYGVYKDLMQTLRDMLTSVNDASWPSQHRHFKKSLVKTLNELLDQKTTTCSHVKLLILDLHKNLYQTWEHSDKDSPFNQDINKLINQLFGVLRTY